MRHSTESTTSISAPVQSTPGCEALETATLAKQKEVKDAAKVDQGHEVAVASAWGGVIGTERSSTGPGSRGRSATVADSSLPVRALQRLRGSPVKLLGRDPASLEGLAQLGHHLVPLGVRYPQVTQRKTPGIGIHDPRPLTASPCSPV